VYWSYITFTQGAKLYLQQCGLVDCGSVDGNLAVQCKFKFKLLLQVQLGACMNIVKSMESSLISLVNKAIGVFRKG